jgi:hypothetical protein
MDSASGAHAASSSSDAPAVLRSSASPWVLRDGSGALPPPARALLLAASHLPPPLVREQTRCLVVGIAPPVPVHCPFLTDSERSLDWVNSLYRYVTLTLTLNLCFNFLTYYSSTTHHFAPD